MPDDDTVTLMRHRLLLKLWAVCLLSTVTVGLHAQGASAPAMLWTVSDDSGSTAYLLGSIHILTADVYPLPPAMDQALARSKVLIEEVLLDEASDPAVAMKMLSRATLPTGTTLQSLVTPEQYSKVTALAETAGLPLPMIRQLKPWMTAMLLSTTTLSRAGYDPAKGIDRYFFDKAKTAGVPVRALESVDYQLERLDGLAMDDQIRLLTEMVSEADTMVREVQTMVDRWRAGDAEGLASLLRPSMDTMPGLEERLLIERNRNWVPHIERCVRERQGCLVVVGAGHLVGRDSVVALLRARGLTVTQHGVPAPAPAMR
jgi:uncharacterized protein YbaP (TraB family)